MGRVKVSKAVCVVGTTIAVVSVVINLLLAKQLLEDFSELQLTRVFPLGHEPEPAGTAMPTGEDFVVLYGDSRVYLWDSAPLARRGPVRNSGHGGQTSSQLLLQLQTETPRPAKWGIVQIGINDIHPIGALPRHKQAILGQLQRNLEEIVGVLLSRCDHVVVTTIIPPGRVPLQRRLVWDSDSLAYLAESNKFIRQLARNNPRVRVLDASALLGGDQAYLVAKYTDPDFFLHISHKGYETLNEALLRMLAETPSAPN